MHHKFGFLLHPRHNVRLDMGELLGAPFSLIPSRAWAAAFDHLPLPPVVTGKVYLSSAPTEAAGVLITVPFTPLQMLSLPRSRVQAKIEAAVDLARDMGAKVVGLGGLTAPATVGGKTLARRNDIGITNGNAFTAAMTLAGISRLIGRLRSDPLIAIVGATGSVGSCLTRLLGQRHVGRLLLVSRSHGRLQALAAETRRQDLEIVVSTQMADVARADLVVLLTSASETLLRSEHLKSGAVVLDDTVPRNTDPQLLITRPDVTVVDGGLVDLNGIRIDGAIGLPAGVIYACLAETILLALEGHNGHFAIGGASVDQAQRMLLLAERWTAYGFKLAPLRSFGKLLDIRNDRATFGREVVACAA